MVLTRHKASGAIRRPFFAPSIWQFCSASCTPLEFVLQMACEGTAKPGKSTVKLFDYVKTRPGNFYLSTILKIVTFPALLGSRFRLIIFPTTGINRHKAERTVVSTTYAPFEGQIFG